MERKLIHISNVSKQFEQISNHLITAKNISANAFRLHCLLSVYYNEGLGYAYPTLDQMAQVLNMSTRTVQRALDELKKEKLIKVGKYTSRCGLYGNNVYNIYTYELDKDIVETGEAKIIEWDEN